MDGGPAGDELVAAFARWAASERVAEAATERSRARWLAEQASSTATWTGTLVDLAEGRAPVLIQFPHSRLTGVLVGVGRDFCVVTQRSGRPALIPVSSIAAVWPENGEGRTASPAGDRSAPLDLAFEAALAALVEDRAPVSLRLGAALVEGDAWAIGDGILTVRTPPPGRRYCYVLVGAMTYCEVR